MSAFEELVQVPDPVRVYDWNGTTWDQRGTIQITGNVDTRAMAMSADGDAVAIQTITNDVPNDDDQQTSSVTVYLWDGTVWTSRPIAANVSSRTYGGNLAISDQGTFLAVADKSTSGNGGFVELYRWGGSTYTQTFMWSGSDGDLFVGETLAMTPSGSALALSMARSNYERVVLHVSLIDGVQQAVTTIDTVFQMSVSLSISDNGATLATGHQSAGNVSVWGAGEVTVWNVSNGSVTQLGGTLTIADSAMFGFHVALSGNGLVLAAYSITDSNNTGQVHLLQYTGGAWDLLETFSEEGGTSLYGTAIALSYNGGVCVVGDRLASSSGNVEVGVVRVYGDDASWDTTEGIADTSEWTQSGTTIAEGTDADSYFGTAVALSSTGDTAVVSGAQGNTLSTLKVLEHNGTTWAPRDASSNPAVDGDPEVWAFDMSSSGTVLVFVDESSKWHRFEWDGSQWLAVGQPQENLLHGDHAVQSLVLHLSADGSVLAVSDCFYGEEGTPAQNSGYVAVFQWDDTEWVSMGTPFTGDMSDGYLDPQRYSESPLLGESMDLSSDGQRIAFSEMLDHCVSVYDYANLTWTLVGDVVTLRAHEPAVQYFSTVALGSERLVVAEKAFHDDGLPLNDDAVRVYWLVSGNWVIHSVLVTGTQLTRWSTSPIAVSSDGNVVAVTLNDTELNFIVDVVTYVWQPHARAAWNAYAVVSETPVSNMAMSSDGTTLALSHVQEGFGQVTMYRRGARVPVPCFHGTTLINLADGSEIHVADVKPGMLVRDVSGRVQEVRRVTRRTKAACVYFRRDAIAPGVPDRTLIVTPNHLLRLPSGLAVLAGALVEMLTARGGATRVRASGARIIGRASVMCGWVDQRLTVYHVAVPEWTFLSVHNIDAETMVQTARDDRRRQRAAKKFLRM